jgi:hypothetical protein
MAFRIRSDILPKILGNFENRYKVKATFSEGLTDEDRIAQLQVWSYWNL